MASKESSPYLLKNIFDSSFVKNLAQSLSENSKSFDSDGFIKQTLDPTWKRKELKQRTQTLVENIHTHLKSDYRTQVQVIKKAAPQFTGLKGIIFPELISTFGLKQPQISLNALKFLTEFSTSEFAIRFFLRQDFDRTMEQMLLWSKDKNEHIRRLSSEGCRPRLPWSFKLESVIQDPSPILSILENLKADESLYVRKSVANNLNDISKDHPELVLEIASRWLKTKNPHTRWIIKHALRTLLKRSDPRALKLFGVHDAKNIIVKNLKCSAKHFQIGEHLSFSFELINSSKQTRELRIEYVIHYVKKNQELSPKVFKLAEKNFAPGSHHLRRRHSLKPMTTRVHHPGEHKVEIVINGKKMATAEFLLKR